MRLSCLVLLLHGLFCAARAADHPAILPAAPAELLPCLPSPPEGWKLITSRGENLLSGWLATEVVREYEFQPPAKDPGAPPLPPKKTFVRISDTGYWQEGKGTSANAKPPKGAKKGGFQGYPMVQSQHEGKMRSMITVKDRFIIVVETENQTPRETEEWLKFINYDLLKRLPDDGPTVLPQPVKMIVVDEINPAQSRTYSSYLNR